MFDLKKQENNNNEVVITKKEKPTKITSTKTGIREGDEVVLLSNDGKKEGFFAYSKYKVQKLNRTKEQFLFFDEVRVGGCLHGSDTEIPRGTSLYRKNAKDPHLHRHPHRGRSHFDQARKPYR